MFDEYPIIYRDMNFLSETYELNDIFLNIVKEDIKAVHAYRTIGDPQILTEATGNMMQSVADFFKKMIERIKEFFRKIMMYINSQFMEIDKFVNKYKKELDEVKKVDFSITGYNFTIHGEPNIEPFKKVVQDYNTDISDLSKIKKSDQIKHRSNQDLSTDNLNRLRGTILGNDKLIDDSDFLEECRKYYRDGEATTISIDVDTSMFRKVISEAPTLVKDKKKAEKLRDDVLSLLDKTQTFFDKKLSVLYVNNRKSYEVKKLKIDEDNKLSTGEIEYQDFSSNTHDAIIREYCSYKANYTRQMASMINTAMTEYVNAYKDKIKMYREIIQKSLLNRKTETETSTSTLDKD